jgi:hypothetical protein
VLELFPMVGYPKWETVLTKLKDHLMMLSILLKKIPKVS